MARVPARRRPAAPTFRPRFTVLLLWFLALFVVLSLLAILPDMLAAYRALPPGEGPLTDADLERARAVARESARGKLVLVFVLTALTTGVLAWRGRLPGTGPRR
jgi:hypothetical protein